MTEADLPVQLDVPWSKDGGSNLSDVYRAYREAVDGWQALWDQLEVSPPGLVATLLSQALDFVKLLSVGSASPS